MKKTLAIAALAAALCVPAITKAQSPLEEDLASLNDNSFQLAALLQDDPILFGEPPKAPMGDEFADRQDNDGKFQRRGGPGMRGERFGSDAQGQGPMMGGKDGRKGFGQERPGAMLAVEDPAKFAELQKLREQEMKIIKEAEVKAKASREEFKKLVEDYKANPTDDAKAKIRAKIAERHDAMLKAKEARLAEFTQKLADAKKDKDTAVDAILEKVLSKDKDAKGDRPGRPGFRGGDKHGPTPGADKPAPPPAKES